MIKRDLDACILQAKDYEEFLELLSEKGYQIKQGKHLAIKPQGMTRFRRCKSLGDMYCEEAIRDRIVKEDIAFYKSKQDIPKVSIVKCRVKRYRRAGLSGLQKSIMRSCTGWENSKKTIQSGMEVQGGYP